MTHNTKSSTLGENMFTSNQNHEEESRLDNRKKDAFIFLDYISSKTGMPKGLLTSEISNSNEDVVLVRIFYTWLLSIKLGFTCNEIALDFIKQDVNLIHYYTERHYEMLDEKNPLCAKYFGICQKLKALYNGEIVREKKESKNNFFIEIAAIENRPLKGSQGYEDYVAEHILNCISDHLKISKEIIKSKTRKREAVTARMIFLFLIREIFEEMSLSKSGSYVGKDDHATVSNNLRTHYKLIESGDREYLSIFLPIRKKCHSLHLSNSANTLKGIVSGLEVNGVSKEKIEKIRQELLGRLESEYVFPPQQISSIYAREGITTMF